MRVISAQVHHVLDFVTVAAFAVAPTALGLGGLSAALAYLLAAVHLVLTLLTHFPSGGARPVPLHLHGMVEAAVGVALVALPWLMGWVGASRWFFVGAGVVILAVWSTSQYRQ